MWGGRYNPIIPFLEAAEDRWQTVPGTATGLDITKGYIDFFEPDVLVEAQPGMADKLGWKTEEHTFGLPRVLTIDQLFHLDYRGELQLSAGIDVTELMFHLYDQEYKYTRRHPQPFIRIKPSPGDAFFDVFGGRYPDDEAFSHVQQNYEDVFSPETVSPCAETSLRLLREGHIGPLWITRHDLEELNGRGGLRDETIYVLDGGNPSDLIDYWNFRLVEQRVTPINLEWFAEHAAFIRELILGTYHPIPGNSFGTMFRVAVIFASSIPQERREALVREHLVDLPRESFYILHNPPIWSHPEYGMQRRETKIIARSKSLSVDEEISEDRSVKLPTLAPNFLNTTHRFNEAHWINLFLPQQIIQDDDIARVYPTDQWHPGFPDLGIGSGLRVAREGWVMDERYATGFRIVRLQTGRDAFVSWLNHVGIDARPSEEGQIAAQVISAAGGLFAVGMFTVKTTVQLLNEMAEGHLEINRDGRRVTSTIPSRTKHINTIRQHFKEREKNGFGFWNKLDYFLKRSVFRAGLRVQCPVCAHYNWFDLESISYNLTCSRCLNDFSFSQAPNKLNDVDWYYRIIGPFSAPDYARGAYSVALTLRCFAPQHDSEMTWSTGLVLETLNCEIDFMAWCRPSRILNDERDEPVLLIGEAKSFGTNAMDQNSLDGLKTVASRFPGAVMVVSSLREIDGYSPDEIDRLRALALWGRRGCHRGKPINPMIVLTGRELFSEMGLYGAWRGDTKEDAFHSSYDLSDPYTISELTLKKYLGMSGYWEERYS